MAKFTYRMQNILDIKIQLENQAKLAYSMANARLKEEQEKLQAIVMRRMQYESQARQLASGELDIRAIRECRRAIDVMKSMQRAQMMNVHAAERNVEIARNELNAVMIERKSHEKLKERAFEEFKQEIARAEGKEIDELVSFTHHES